MSTAAQKPRRSPRYIKAASRILQKEARKILRKHGSRIAADPADAIRASVAAIDTHRADGRLDALEHEAEQLDELLHQHASFARKSAWRETLENVGLAVLIALGLRSCFYEPFKIPSGSMMPTLRAGDHIFVNKFVYGVQVPFTTTVVGESIGHIERGDVVVFRYPLDESEDFIKRVMGLPGDEIRVAGREVAVRRAGQAEFEVLARLELDTPCHDETGTKVITGCQLFEETNGDKTYVVRYMSGFEAREDFVPDSRIWKVPDGHLLVMGDNRNQSHDSLAWSVNAEAVGADNLLTARDLRDLTDERLFTLKRPDEQDTMGGGQHDRVIYYANHRSVAHDLSLSVWRDPVLGPDAVFEALRQTIPAAKTTTVAELLADQSAPSGAERDRTLEVGATIDALVLGQEDEGWRVLAYLQPSKTILDLRCGQSVCKTTGRLAARLTAAIAAFHRNHEQDARELLERPPGLRYGTHWTGRGAAREHYGERAFAAKGDGAGAPGTIRLQAFRKPDIGVGVLRDAALHAAGSSRAAATPLPTVGEDAWLVDRGDHFVYVGSDATSEVAVMLECGRKRCRTKDDVAALAQKIHGRMPKAAEHRRNLKQLLKAEDVPGWTELTTTTRERHEYDRVRFEATTQGKEHTIEVEAWLKPKEGFPAKLAELQRDYGLTADQSVTPGGFAAESDDAYVFAFGVSESETVIRVSCRKGLCDSRDEAVALARRAATKALDPSNFIDPDAERPQPFVPRGHVKGRAERIWLPLARFWLPIR